MKSKIKTLMIEPGKVPETYYIEPTIKAFRNKVNEGSLADGDIEAKHLTSGVYAIFHKDRFLTDLLPNRSIGDDIISGTIFIVATDDNKQPVSLSDTQTSIFTMMFWNPETFDDMDVMEANMNTMLSRLWQDV